MDKDFVAALCRPCVNCTVVVINKSGRCELACQPQRIATLCRLVPECPNRRHLEVTRQ